MSSAPSRIGSGTAIGPYVVERPLSPNASGSIYVARDSEGARVVLQLLPVETPTNAMRARALREARTLAAVDHASVVRVHGVGEHDGAPWLAVEYVPGQTFRRVLLDRGPMALQTALRHTIQIAEALLAAHGAGIAHRDLRPENVIVTPDGRLVLVEFGIAKRRAELRESGVTSGVFGMTAYLAPEQLEHGLADERSDIWALGCMLYEMVAGTPPFGKGGAATMASILRDEPVFPPQLTGTILHVISASLRKSSFARIASPRELLTLLRDALDENRVGATATTVPPASTDPAPSWMARGSGRSANSPSTASPSSTPPYGSSGPRIPAAARVPSIQSRATSLPPPRSTRGSTPPPPASPASSRSSSTRIATGPGGRIKGTSVRAGLVWFAETYGAPALASTVDSGSRELRSLLRRDDPVLGIMASGWYDTERMGELLDALERVGSPADPAVFLSRLAEAVAKENVAGVYRALFRLVSSPPLLQANAQRVWRTYVSEGTLTVDLVGRGSFDARIDGWSHHHPTVCRLLRGVLEHTLRNVGYTALVVDRTRCIEEGDGQCAFEGAWAF